MQEDRYTSISPTSEMIGCRDDWQDDMNLLSLICHSFKLIKLLG